MVSGAEKAVKDLEQLAAADPEALIDSIEELLPAGTSQEAGVATAVNAGLATGVTGLADPVLSKGSGSLAQGGGDKPAVKCCAGWLHCCAAREGVVPKQCLYSFDRTQAVPFPIVYAFADLQASKGPLFSCTTTGQKVVRCCARFCTFAAWSCQYGLSV